MTECKAVLLLDKNTLEIVKRYNSCTEAADDLGYDRATIDYRCRRSQQRNIDYIFMFEENYIEANNLSVYDLIKLQVEKRIVDTIHLTREQAVELIQAVEALKEASNG